MRIVIASESPVKNNAVKRALEHFFKEEELFFESVKANSGVGDQPMSSEETRKGALGRLAHARTLKPEADFYVSLEGGIDDIDENFFSHGWVIIESKEGKRGFGKTVTFVLPPAIRGLMLNEGLEMSHATDRILSKSGTKHGTGTIGPLTKEFTNYTEWYFQAVVCALLPFINEDLY